jgi:hypothetical protein
MRTIMSTKFLLLFYFLCSQSVSQNINGKINEFFTELIKSSGDVSEYLEKIELENSKRLGIEYTDVQNKFMISFDIDETIKKEIRKGMINYKLKEEKLERNFSKFIFQVPEKDYSKEFFFKEDKLVSPAFYFTSAWKNYKTKYFNFFISDPSLFNDYCAAELENFVSVMSELLQFSIEQKRLLEKEKIIYILCRDEEEVKQLTGFATRGIYILAYDRIITAYNCHFHELAQDLLSLLAEEAGWREICFSMPGIFFRNQA